MSVIEEIVAERQRQIGKLGYITKHDDEHDDGSLALAAALYATPHRLYVKQDYADGVAYRDPWPWNGGDARPYEGNMVRGNGTKGEKYRRRLLVKAAALIVAEIERIDRQPLSGTA